NLLNQTERLTILLREIFAEVPMVLETIEKDTEDIDGIREREASTQQWANEITYEAQIGLLFKNTLRISPSGLEWKEKQYALSSIVRVRWGGIRRSVNGIP